ncbi:hypothetical protein FEM48_Zijuj05G0136600 [Ziziphus jujuba var. spinosa]|uniref:Uncharacterized protein n=1 Tax=Ziziphus jujuba var. spinosa TaxID=714518 RepID=A0A978VF56_ZIZJJ|nr:hypothetical protein FEM48_Zijuj05G0136600 [Ziziphus jujuba var. spinosa]
MSVAHIFGLNHPEPISEIPFISKTPFSFSGYIVDDDNNNNNNESSNPEEEELIGSSYMNYEKKIYASDDDIFMHNLTVELEANVLQHGNEKQVMECCKLIERCLSLKSEDRPGMIEVAKTLGFINNIK